jgi:hypothetical protein
MHDLLHPVQRSARNGKAALRTVACESFPTTAGISSVGDLELGIAQDAAFSRSANLSGA